MCLQQPVLKGCVEVKERGAEGPEVTTEVLRAMTSFCAPSQPPLQQCLQGPSNLPDTGGDTRLFSRAAC